jgi:ABC-type multidrug transport system fused ATPase/permease subunit
MRSPATTRRHLAAVVLAALLATVAAVCLGPAQAVRADDISCTWGWPTTHCSYTHSDGSSSPAPAPGAAAPARKPGLLHRMLHPAAVGGPALSPAPAAPPPLSAPDMAPAAAPQSTLFGPAPPATSASPSLTHRAVGYVAHGALDHVSNFLVDGVVTALGWLRQSLLSPSLEPNWHVVNPAYSEMTALALGLVIAFVALALLEHLAGGVHGAGASVLSRLIAAVMVALAGLPLMAWFVQGVDSIASLWTASMGSASTQVLDRLTQMLQNHSGGGVPEAAAIAILCLFALITTLLVVAWLVLRLVLVQALVVFLPLVAVMAIYPRTSGTARRMGEYLASLILTKLAMVIFLSVGFQILAFGLQGVPDWLAITSATVLLGMVAFTPWALLRGIHLAEMETMGFVKRRAGTAPPLGAMGAAGEAAAGSVAWGIGQMHRRDAEEGGTRPRAPLPATYRPRPERSRPPELPGVTPQESGAAAAAHRPPVPVGSATPSPAPAAAPALAPAAEAPTVKDAPRNPAPPPLRPRVQPGS